MAKLILVVDDEMDLLSVVTFRLTVTGYDVLSAADGRQAMELMITRKPDLVLLDLNMPLLNGWETCRKMRENAELKDVPVILLSASSSAVNLEAVKAVGAQDFMIKPFESESLLDKIKGYIKG